jgi:hypothetical protein
MAMKNYAASEIGHAEADLAGAVDAVSVDAICNCVIPLALLEVVSPQRSIPTTAPGHMVHVKVERVRTEWIGIYNPLLCGVIRHDCQWHVHIPGHIVKTSAADNEGGFINTSGGISKVLQIRRAGWEPSCAIDVRHRRRCTASGGMQICHGCTTSLIVPKDVVGANRGALDGQVYSTGPSHFVRVTPIRMWDRRAPHAIVCNGSDFATGPADPENALRRIRIHSHHPEPVPFVHCDMWQGVIANVVSAIPRHLRRIGDRDSDPGRHQQPLVRTITHPLPHSVVVGDCWLFFYYEHTERAIA